MVVNKQAKDMQRLHLHGLLKVVWEGELLIDSLANTVNAVIEKKGMLFVMQKCGVLILKER